MNNKGIKNIYYMPVAANVKRLDAIEITNEDKARYKCDISFIGAITKSEYANYMKNKLTEVTRNQIEELIERQTNEPTHFSIKNRCTQGLVEEIKKKQDIL